MLGLLQMTGVRHILYGSDYPYAFPNFIAGEMQKLLSTEILSGAQRRKILFDNATELVS